MPIRVKRLGRIFELLEASNCCEKGMLLVIIGFILVLDMLAKFAFSPVAHCVK